MYAVATQSYSPGASRRQAEQLPSHYSQHVIWTTYLQRITSGDVTNYTPEECRMADEWEQIQYEIYKQAELDLIWARPAVKSKRAAK